MKQEEIKKPENYTEGGNDKIVKMFLGSIVQIGFIIFLLVWVISSLYISIIDVFTNKFEYSVLAYSFIGGIITSGYLTVMMYIKRKKLGIKKPKIIKKCTSCGKK